MQLYKKINGHELSWALGAAFNVLQNGLWRFILLLDKFYSRFVTLKRQNNGVSNWEKGMYKNNINET